MRGRNPAGRGPTPRRRVGKSKKVVKRRGVGVLVFEEENCLERWRGRKTWTDLVRERVRARVLGRCRVGRLR